MNRTIRTILIASLINILGFLILRKFDGIYFQPLIFGASIPIANWADLKFNRIQKVAVNSIAALAIFIIGMLTSVALENIYVAILIAGLCAIPLQLLLNVTIARLNLKYSNIFLTSVLCGLAFPIGDFIFANIELINYNANKEYGLGLWFLFFIIGVSTGSNKEQTANKTYE